MLICLLLVGLGVVFIAEYESRQTVSTTENRRLAVWPELTQVSLLDGSFARAVELYVADHFPLREYFTEIASLVKTSRGLMLDGRVVQVKGGEAGFEDVNSWAKPQASLVQENPTKEGSVDTEIALVTPGLDRDPRRGNACGLRRGHDLCECPRARRGSASHEKATAVGHASCSQLVGGINAAGSCR
jgi:hypothetical protein